MKPKILIPLATIGLIFVPMLVLSIQMNAFWIDSPYDFPFITIPAVAFGDVLLLPPLNYFIYLALKDAVPLAKPYAIFFTVAGGFVVAVVVNAYTHYLWSHDAFTGFMDPQYGVLSVAGWWHMVISIIQMALVYIFATFWILTVKKLNADAFKAFERSLYIFMAFSVVNMSGTFVDKDLFISGRFTPDLDPRNLLNAFFPIIISIVLLLSMRRMHRLVQAGSEA